MFLWKIQKNDFGNSEIVNDSFNIFLVRETNFQNRLKKKQELEKAQRNS